MKKNMPMFSMETEDSAPPPPLAECYPETLPVENVKESLRRYGVPFASDASHDHLNRLYREYLAPKPQRTNARSNRRGQQIQIQQIREEKCRKRRAEFDVGSLASGSKNLKFTTAESVNNSNNAPNFKAGKSAPNFDPVNGRLKPPPGSAGSSNTVAKVKMVDSLAEIKINDGPRKFRDLPGGGGGDSGERTVDGGGGGDDGKDSVISNPSKKGKFWNMFGSISHDVITLSELPPTEKRSEKPIQLETGFKRTVKLNRKTVLPNEIPANCVNNPGQHPQISSSPSSSRTSSPLNDSLKSTSSSKSASPMNGSPRLSRGNKISMSESGSDMDVSEVAPFKPKTIAKITWP